MIDIIGLIEKIKGAAAALKPVIKSIEDLFIKMYIAADISLSKLLGQLSTFSKKLGSDFGTKLKSVSNSAGKAFDKLKSGFKSVVGFVGSGMKKMMGDSSKAEVVITKSMLKTMKSIRKAAKASAKASKASAKSSKAQTSLASTVSEALNSGPSVMGTIGSGAAKLGSLAVSAAGFIGSGITTGIQYNAENNPEFADMGKQIAQLQENGQALLGEITAPLSEMIVSTILPSALDGLSQITEAFRQNGLSGMLEVALEIINNFLITFLEQLPAFMETGFSLMRQLLSGIQQYLPQFLTTAMSVLGTFISGIVSLIPGLIDVAVQIINTLVQYIIANLPQIISTGGTLLLELINGVMRVLPSLVSLAWNIIVQLAQALKSKAIELANTAASIGKDFIDGILNGILSNIGKLTSKAMNALGGFVGDVLHFFGINSPSRLMRDEVGKYLALGIGKGFVEEMPIDEMEKELGRTVKKMNAAAYNVQLKEQYRIPQSASAVLSGGDIIPLIDYDELERRYVKAQNRANEKPVVLNGRQINRALNKRG